MKKIGALLLALIICAQTFAPGTRSFASPVDGIVMSLSTDKSVVDSGEEFSYLINYSASSTIGNYTNPSISLLVPEGVTYTDKMDSSITTSTVTDSIDFPRQKEVTFQFNGGILPAGSAGQLVVKGKFENYVTPDGTSATTEAVFMANEDGTPVSMESNEATVTSQGSAPWSIEIKRILPIAEPYKGSDVQYEISVKPVIGNGNGLLDIMNIVVTARLDNGAIFVNADNGGTPGPDNTVVWNLSDGLRSAKSLKFIVNYPDSMPATEVTTSAEMTATPLGGTPTTNVSQVTHGFETSPIDAGTSFNLYTNAQEISPGQTVKLYLSGLSNKANVALDSGVLEIMTPTQTIDGTPLELQLQTIKSALFSGISTYDLYYTLVEYPTAGDWQFGCSLSASTATTYDATLFGDIKGIQFRFGTLLIDWSQESNFEFAYRIPSNFVVPANSSEIISSLATFDYSFNGVTKTISDNSETSIVDDRPLLELQNTVSKTSVVPSETVTYTLSVKNDTSLSSGKLDNPVIYNMLPADLEYVPESWSIVKPAGTPTDPTFTAVPQPSGETKLTWSWDSNPGQLHIGENVQIQFKAKIKPGTQAKTVMNTFGVESPYYLNDVNYSNQKTVGTTTYSVKATSSIKVEESAALQSRMWVKGELDASWSGTGSTTPGGQALYRMEIENIGNVAMKKLTIVNPFPRIGDSAVLNGSVLRGSQWGPILTGAVNAPAYVTVYYSTTPGITMHSSTGVDNGVWTESPPADLTSVQAIKMVYDDDYVIDPLTTTTLEWAMRAPVGAPTGGEIAWNSFAYQVKNASAQSLLPAESNKVGMKILSSQKASIGDFVWLDSNENGLLDAGESGLNGVTVELYDENGTKLAETVTSNDFGGNSGAYLFPNLEPGQYRVVFEPDSLYEAISSEVITLGAGENYLQLDAGIVFRKGKIGSYVWVDANGNGLQDAGESGLNGVTINLYNGSGTLLSTTTTATSNGQSGYYVFNNLNPGNYQVEFVLPSAEYGFTLKNAGADATKHSDADPATGQTSVFSLAQGEENLTVDAGLLRMPSVSVAGRVWLDANGNGVQDGNEDGINGIQVELYDEHDLKISQTTTADQSGVKGKYGFDDLLHGKYYVKFIYPTSTYLPTRKQEGTDRTIDSDMNADGSSDLLTLLPGVTATVDAGLYLKSVLQSGGSTTPTPTPTPTPEPEQMPNPPKEPFKEIVDRDAFLANLKTRIEQANQSNERIELTDLQGHWAKNAIQTFIQLGLVRGYSNGKFAPNEEITRGEFVTILSRMIDFTGSSQQTADFNDISNHWAKLDIVKLSGAGIVKGYSNGSFLPNQGISREEAVVVISRLIHFDALDKIAANGQFSDLSAVGSYARNEVQATAEVGIVKGKPAGNFDPKGKITRAEAVTMLLNVLRLHPEAKKLLGARVYFIKVVLEYRARLDEYVALYFL